MCCDSRDSGHYSCTHNHACDRNFICFVHKSYQYGQHIKIASNAIQSISFEQLEKQNYLVRFCLLHISQSSQCGCVVIVFVFVIAHLTVFLIVPDTKHKPTTHHYKYINGKLNNCKRIIIAANIHTAQMCVMCVVCTRRCIDVMRMHVGSREYICSYCS